MTCAARGDAQGTEQGSLLLQRARFEIMDLLRGADEGQIALIGYGAEPFVIAPLTTDAATIIEQVPVLAPDLLPLTGPGRVDLALDMAAGLLRPSGAAQGDVILVAGGLPGPDAALEAAARLRADGHRLSVLAVANVPAFAQLASAGGGLLLPARADGLDTDRLLALAGKRVPTPSGDRIITDAQWRDEGYWLLLLLLPIAALAFRRGWLGLLPLALLLNPPSLAQAWSWQDLWLRPEQQALRMLADGHLSAVDERFDDPRWRAAAFYRAGRYRQALGHWPSNVAPRHTTIAATRWPDCAATTTPLLNMMLRCSSIPYTRMPASTVICCCRALARGRMPRQAGCRSQTPSQMPSQMPSRRRNKPPPSPQMRTPPVTANRQTNPAPAPVTKLIIVTSASCPRRALQRRLRICRAATTSTPRPRERLLARVSMSALSSAKRRP
jgi:hypothetical protein